MPSTVAAGVRHLRAEWGRWWTTDDLTEAYVGHTVLNDQYLLWRRTTQQMQGEVRQSVRLLGRQQRLAQRMQQQRMAMMRRAARGGGSRGRGGFGGLGMGLMMGGSSPMVAYRMMQWRQLAIQTSQQEFTAPELTNAMLAAGRGQLRAHRRRTAVLLGLLLALVFVGACWVSAVAGLTVTAAAAAAGMVAAWSAGRNPVRRRPAPPPLLFVPSKKDADLEVEPDPEPFALAEAGRTPKVAREAVRLALLHRGAPVAEIGRPEETTYGWRVPFVLDGSGTMAGLVKLLPKLATTLRLGESRVLLRAVDPNDAARGELLLLQRDPFAEPLPYPYRPPLSCSIRTPLSIGLSLDGETTPVVLAGQHVIIVGDTGSGKTSMVQCMAEYATACTDAVVWDVDPAKRGLKALAPLAARTARTPAEAEAVLAEAVALAKARTASMPPTQDNWKPSPEGPAVLVFLDEHPRLSARGKELAVELLQIGREPRVTLVLLTQDATEDVLGDAVADAPGVRILMPCRAADVPLVVGRQDAVSRGWLPHFLVPSPDEDDPADAGRFYCVTPKHKEPILRYVSPLPPESAARLAKERLAAGLPVLAAPTSSAAEGVAEDVPDIARLLLGAFDAEGVGELTVEQLAPHLVAADPETWGQWEEMPDRRRRIGSEIRRQIRAAGLDITPHRQTGPGRPTAYRRAAVEEALRNGPAQP